MRKLNIAVTGASRGIGAAVSRVLARDHYVTLLARDIGAMRRVVMDIPQEHVRMVECDICSRASVEHACSLLGDVDVLINNAGIARFGSAVEMEFDTSRRQIETNLLGPIDILTHVVPGMVERRSGLIITINSVAATTVFGGAAAYSASKAGMLAYTRSLRQDVRSAGVKVVDLIVGATNTEIWDSDSRSKFADRMLSAEHIASSVAAIVSNADDPNMMIEEMIIRPQLGDL